MHSPFGRNARDAMKQPLGKTATPCPTLTEQTTPRHPNPLKYLDVITLFPALFAPWLQEGLMARAKKRGLIQLTLVPLRQYGLGPRHNVDATPYGGGPGMVLRPEPIAAALEARTQIHKAKGLHAHCVLLTPQGKPIQQAMVEDWAQQSKRVLTLICGRYEGFDERVRQTLVDEEVCVGDFICLGGEALALAVLEAVVRLLPGSLGNKSSPKEESFSNGGLEYAQYTKPLVFKGYEVPPVLRSGNHAQITTWRQQQAKQRTRLRRPDLSQGKG